MRSPGSSEPGPSVPGYGHTRSPRARGRCMSPGYSDAGSHEHGAKDPESLVGAEGWIRHPFGMRHDTDDVAALVADASDVVRRAVWVLQVAQHDALLVLQPRKRLRVGEVVSLVVGNGQNQLFARITPCGPWRVCALDTDVDAVAYEAH